MALDDLTPLQKLDDAVNEYFASLEDDGVLCAWVLSFQSSVITDQPHLLPLAFASDFVMSAGTSPELAVGLSRITQRRLEVQLASEFDDE